MQKRNSFFIAIFVLMLAVIVAPAQVQSFRALHQFNGKTPGDGAVPHGTLLLNAAGDTLFGTTLDGGNGDGTVFKIDSTGKETVLLTFDSAVNGDSPDSPLIQDAAGNLYGVTPEGGPNGAFGVVYRISPQGELTILHAFQGDANSPAVPTGGLVMDKLGNLYGTTFDGGNSPNCLFGCGTIYRLDPAGNFQVLYEFTGLADGDEPFGPLVPDAKGNLYGVSKGGGVLCPDQEFDGEGCGAVYRLNTNGTLKVLHTFQGGGDGAIPQGGLVFNDAGDLFGVASRGGRIDKGKVFTISKNGTYSILHPFVGSDGDTPNGGLVLDEAGNLYGTAIFGGTHSLGTVFKLRPDGQLTVLHAFHGSTDGSQPAAGLIRDAHGHLFGTTSSNLLNQSVQGGNVFEITP
jgi:uncharacterized repeat protein (TIGR03803 family)